MKISTDLKKEQHWNLIVYHIRKGSRSLFFVYLTILGLLISSLFLLTIYNHQLRVSLVSDNNNNDTYHLLMGIESPAFKNYNNPQRITNIFSNEQLHKIERETNSKLSPYWTMSMTGDINGREVYFYLGIDSLFQFELKDMLGYLSSDIKGLISSQTSIDVAFSNGSVEKKVSLNISNWPELDPVVTKINTRNAIILPHDLFFKLWADAEIAELGGNPKLIYTGWVPEDQTFPEMENNFKKWVNDWRSFYQNLNVGVVIFDIENQQGLILLKDDYQQFLLISFITQLIILPLLMILGISLPYILESALDKIKDAIRIQYYRGGQVPDIESELLREIRNIVILTSGAICGVFSIISIIFAIEFYSFLLSILLIVIFNMVIYNYQKKTTNTYLTKLFTTVEIERNVIDEINRSKFKANTIVLVVLALFAFGIRPLLGQFIILDNLMFVEIGFQIIFFLFLIRFIYVLAYPMIYSVVEVFSENKWDNGKYIHRGIYKKVPSLKGLSLISVANISLLIILILTSGLIINSENQNQTWKKPVEGSFSLGGSVRYDDILSFAAKPEIKTLSYTIDGTFTTASSELQMILIGNLDEFQLQNNQNPSYFKSKTSKDAYGELATGNCLVSGDTLNLLDKSFSDQIIGELNIPTDVNSNSQSTIETISTRISGSLLYFPMTSSIENHIVMSADNFAITNDTMISKVFFELSDTAKNRGVESDQIIKEISPMYVADKGSNPISLEPLQGFVFMFLIVNLIVLTLTVGMWAYTSLEEWKELTTNYISRGSTIKNLIQQIGLILGLTIGVTILIAICCSFLLYSIIQLRVDRALPYPVPFASKEDIFSILMSQLVMVTGFLLSTRIIIKKSLLKGGN